MSRLIDANKLIKYIEKSRKENPHNDIKIAINHSFEHFHCIKLVNEQPTAYDVDKVVEQLEKNHFHTDATFDDDGYCNDDSEEVVNLNEAIEIIKRGGIDE